MAYELEREIKNTVKEAYKRGFTEEEARYELRKKGVPITLINKLLSEAKPKRSLIKAAFFILAIILVILGLVIALTFFKPGVKACTSSECFIKQANNCKEATFYQELEGTLFEYVSFDSCRVIKTVTFVSPKEPEEIKDLLKDASMVCLYDKREFNPNLVNSIGGGLEDCSGSLKVAINDIIDSL